MRFKRMYIEIINTCNLSCDFCIQNQRAPKALSVNECKHIAQEIRPFCKHIYLHVMGEPLSHPNLEAILNVFHEAGFYIHITTNGTLLKKQQDVLLRSSISQINISLHSFPQHHMSHYLQDIFDVSQQLVAKHIHVNYRLWSLQKNALTQETETILHTVEERYHVHIQNEQKVRLQRIDLQPFLHLHFEEIFSWPSLDAPFVSEKGRCLGMQTMCGILSNGDVVPCCLDSKGDVFLGNILQMPFVQILKSKRMEMMIEGFQNHRLAENLCRHCGYRTRF